jgi:hypothetical protein
LATTRLGASKRKVKHQYTDGTELTQKNSTLSLQEKGMAQKEALKTLLDAADLLSMVEDLFSPGVAENLSSASVSGMRLTLRGVKNAILEGHDVLATDLLMKARGLSGEVEAISDGNSAKNPQTINQHPGWNGDNSASLNDHHGQEN